VCVCVLSLPQVQKKREENDYLTVCQTYINNNNKKKEKEKEKKSVCLCRVDVIFVCFALPIKQASKAERKGTCSFSSPCVGVSLFPVILHYNHLLLSPPPFLCCVGKHRIFSKEKKGSSSSSSREKKVRERKRDPDPVVLITANFIRKTVKE